MEEQVRTAPVGSDRPTAIISKVSADAKIECKSSFKPQQPLLSSIISLPLAWGYSACKELHIFKFLSSYKVYSKLNVFFKLLKICPSSQGQIESAKPAVTLEFPPLVLCGGGVANYCDEVGEKNREKNHFDSLQLFGRRKEKEKESYHKFS